MSDTFITVVAIVLAAVLVFVVPLMTTAQRVDDVSQTDVETLTSNFIDEIRTTGKLTTAEYNKFLENLAATGNTYDVSIEFKILDENPGKKSTQTTKDKIGENVYYSIYTTQIEEALNNGNQENTYNLKQGDMVSITVRNTNLTLGQQLKNFGYKIVGNDTYTISASKSGMVVGNGSTEIVLSDNDLNKDEIAYTLNDANGRQLKSGEWTNTDIYVELSKKSTYNLDLFYYWRKAEDTEDYNDNYTKLDGNNLTFSNKIMIQAYWKSSALEKYSNIVTIDIKIDKEKPTIESVTGSTEKSNRGTITVTAKDNTYGSGLAAYYYKWENEGVTPTAPTKDTDGWTNYNKIEVNSSYNGQRCWVWVKDKAGNISETSKNNSATVENIVPEITDVNLKSAIIKIGDDITIKPDIVTEEGTVIDYKDISFDSSDTSIATINAEGKATGIKAGKTTITCKITNYNEKTVEKTCTLSVIGIEYSPNGGNYVLNYNNGTTETATIKTTVTIIGAETAKYAWSDSKTTAPTSWTDYDSNNGGVVTTTSKSASTYYLWSQMEDSADNTITFVSNSFVITAQKITIKPSTTSWTNSDITCTIKYTPSNTTNITMKVGYGAKIENAIAASKTVTSTTTSIKVTANGSVYASATDVAGNTVVATLTITNIDKTAPSASINLSNTNIEASTSITAAVTHTDDLSGVNTANCKWVYNTTSSAIGTDASKYTGGTFSSNTEKITLNTSTAGTYYLHVLTIDKAGNKKETISNAVTVSYPLLASKVNVGDYVAYDATNNYSYTSPKGTGLSNGNGHSSQTFTSSSNVKWRVFSKNESTGEVVLISETALNDFYMRGAIGYIWGEYELNHICSIYGHGTGANTNITDSDPENKGFIYYVGGADEKSRYSLRETGARSLNFKDICNINGYSNTTKTVTLKHYYPTRNTNTGYSTSAVYRTEETNPVRTNYEDTSEKVFANIPEGTTMHKMIFNGTYWLGSRCSNEAHDSSIGNTINYCVDQIWSSAGIWTFYVFEGGQNGVVENESHKGVRPLVYLKTTVQTSGQNSSGAWTIVDK